MKVKELYLSLRNKAKEFNIPELDIRDLISFYQGYKENSSFFLSFNDEIKDLDKINEGFIKLSKGEPLGYIIGETSFLSRKYIIKKGVLVPRPETEELVLLAVRKIKQYLPDKVGNILDIGCGSGVISIELMKRLNQRVDAIDIDDTALLVGELNIKKHNADVNLYKGDTYPNNNKKYQVIISNPPYILYKEDIDQSVLDYEPLKALLLTKENDVYEKIFKDIDKYITFPCLLFFEIAPNIKEHLNELMIKYLGKYQLCYSYSLDINKKERFLSVIISEDENNN